MIEYYKKTDSTLVKLPDIQARCWVNIHAPFGGNELESFADLHDFPLDFLTDSLDIDERSRYEREDHARLILVNTPLLNEAEKESDAIYVTAPIGIIMLPDHIVTISRYENPILSKFIDSRVKNFTTDDHRLFVLQIFEQTVYFYLECLKRLNLKRNLIETELYNSSRSKELQQLLRIEKSLVYFVNSLSSNELMKMKMKRTDFLGIKDDEDLADLFDDLIIDNSQALEMSNVYTNILNGTMEAYASIISNNMNVFIHRLTIITIILMVPTVVASFFGMNVPLPFSDNPYAFYMIIFFSICLGFLLIWFFRRRKLF